MINSKFSKSKRGFTLTELLVVIAILAVLSTVVIIGYSHSIKRSAITTDNLLAEQINAHLNIEKTTSDFQNDNEIAKIIQANFDRNTPVETKEYDMDIYYNSDTQRFEVMSNSEVNDKYQNLNYYFNLSTFNISKTYFEAFEPVKTFENTDEQLCSYTQNNNLYIYISKDESNNLKAHSVDLSKIISAHDCEGNTLPITFNSNMLIDDNKLLPSAPGSYEVKCISNDSQNTLEYTLKVYVKNVYLSIDAEINANDVTHKVNKINQNTLTISTNNLRYNLEIKDYHNSGLSPYFVELSEQTHLVDSITFLIYIGDEIIETPITPGFNEFIVNLDSIESNDFDTIKVRYRYQGINGVYCYSEEKILTIKE